MATTTVCQDGDATRVVVQGGTATRIVLADKAITQIAAHGVQGPPGPAGVGADARFTFAQPTPAAIWSITHALNKFPAVTVVDSAGSVVVGDVDYTSNTHLTITFVSPFSGTAYLN